jgi:hypothetical protein
VSDERLGIVPLSMPDGRTVPLRFTWRAIDTLGAARVGELLEAAGSGRPGDMTALAALVEAASGGKVSVDDLMNGQAPAFGPCYLAVLTAWAGATRVPQGEDGDKADANPLQRLLTWSSGLWRRLSR